MNDHLLRRVEAIRLLLSQPACTYELGLELLRTLSEQLHGPGPAFDAFLDLSEWWDHERDRRDN